MSALCLRLILALSLIAASLTAAEPGIHVVIAGDQRPVAVEAIGLSSDQLVVLAKSGARDMDCSSILAVYVFDPKGGIQPPALAGRYEVAGDRLRFTPQFALRPGMNYQVHLIPPAPRGTGSLAVIKHDISLPPPPPAPPTKVTAIYPSASTLPENQLRFYVHFSGEMAAGDAYAHVKLVRDTGNTNKGEVVSRAFLEIGEELWDGAGQRITLLFDPGRVKKGLAPRLQFGPVLEAGQSYRLIIDRAWRDANNRPLAESFEKRFTVGPAVEKAVAIADWKITAPSAETREALVIRFPWPLDRALLLRMITVADDHMKPVAGEITLADEERRWEFRPDQPWTAGQFSIVADKELEDSAGNNLARPFEVDVFDRVDDRPGPEFTRIPFEIRAK